ncbi:hypothetical protein PENTCL1PPCAC_1466, partial [Pristionchus entomophagus]
MLSMTTETVILSPSSHRCRIISCSSETLRVSTTEHFPLLCSTETSILTLSMPRSSSSFFHFFAAAFTSA